MEITLFGILWIAILICAGIVGQKTLAKCVIISALFQAGAVFIIGESVITPFTVSCFTYTLFSLCRHRFKIKVPRFFRYFFIMWLIIFCSSAVSSVLFRGTIIQRTSGTLENLIEEYQGHIAVFALVELLIFGVTAVLIFDDKPLNGKDFDKLIDGGFLLVLIIGVWQFTTKMGLIPRSTLIESLVYSNTVSNSIEYNNTSFSLEFTKIRFHSCFMEPSYLGGFLGAIFYHYISRFVKEKHSLSNGVKAILVGIMVILSYSTTAFAVVALACVISAIQFNSVKRLIRVVGITALALGILVVIINSLGLWEKIIRNSIEKFDTGSAMIRGTWNDACIQAFKDTFGIGVGYSNLFGSSFIFTLLGSMGVMGSLCYLLFILSALKPSMGFMGHVQSQTLDIPKFAGLVVLSMAAQMVAVGRLNYSIFWMFLFILMAAYGAVDLKIENEGIIKKRINLKLVEEDPLLR